MRDRLEKNLREQSLVNPGDRLLVAVSGGADSVALLHLLSELSADYPFDIMVAYLDHQLRPESREDAGFVEALCRRLGVPAFIEQCDVKQLAGQLGTGLEDAGRQARREFLERIADEQDCSAIALAHHADDQAETILFRLLRGSGLSGLAAMKMKTGRYLRPLLTFGREELRSYLQQNDIAWREDASNEDQSFSRNRIRHQLLPNLREYNPRVVDALNRLGRQAADEESYWEQVAVAFLDRVGQRTDDGFEIPVDELLKLGRAERRRMVRSFLEQAREFLAGIEADHIDLVERLVESDTPQADLDLPGLWVGRRYNRLLCASEQPGVPEYEIEITEPGAYRLPTGMQLVFSVGNERLEEDDDTVLFPANQLSFPLQVRSPRPGDRFQPSGMTGTKLLKDYFIDTKIDRESRQRTPVVWSGEEIIWLAGRRRCEQFRPAQGEKLLKITLLKPKQAVE